MARKRWQGTTTQRGYGSQHQQERERRLAQYKPGDRCAHGGEPMWWWPLELARTHLHLPHTPDRTGYLPGLACARHNLADGARTTNRRRRHRRQQPWQPPLPLPWQPSRDW